MLLRMEVQTNVKFEIVMQTAATHIAKCTLAKIPIAKCTLAKYLLPPGLISNYQNTFSPWF